MPSAHTVTFPYATWSAWAASWQGGVPASLNGSHTAA